MYEVKTNKVTYKDLWFYEDKGDYLEFITNALPLKINKNDITHIKYEGEEIDWKKPQK